MSDFLEKALRRPFLDDEDEPEPMDFVMEPDGQVHRPGVRTRLERQRVTELRAAVAVHESGLPATPTLSSRLYALIAGFQDCLAASRNNVQLSQGWPAHEAHWHANVDGYDRVIGGLQLMQEALVRYDHDRLRQGFAAFESAMIDLEDIVASRPA